METRICKRCGIQFAIERFPPSGYITKSGKVLRRHVCCGCYYKNNTRKQAWKMQDWLENYKKTLACERCGENDHRCLEFHHRNPDDKLFEVSSKAGKGYGVETILKEIAKCDVVCANCHRKLTYDIQKSSRNRAVRSVG